MSLKRRRTGRVTALTSAVAAAMVAALGADDPARVLRDGFESPRPSWVQEQTDATIRLETQDRSTRAAHEGRSSEHFKFSAGVGSALYFSYALPRVPVAPDLKAGLYVRANRVGVQLFARVVVPRDADPETKEQTFLLIPGTIYENGDRWQRLELADLGDALERQARVLRASTKRPVNLQGAYVDQLVVNLFGGSGETEVFLDELTVGPTTPAAVATFQAALEGKKARDDRAAGRAPAAELQLPEPEAGAAADPESGGSNDRARSNAKVKVDRNRLSRMAPDGQYHPWVFSGIYAPGADVRSLRDHGFELLVEDIDADPKRFQDAVNVGFLLMPSIGHGPDGSLVDPKTASAAIASFPFRESVAAWNLGDKLGRGVDQNARDTERDELRAVVSQVRTLPSNVSQFTTGLVDDEFPAYARLPRNLDMIGVRPSSWGGSYGPLDVYHYFRQRRDLTARVNPGALFWAMIPASAPAAVTNAVWGRDVPPPWGYPQVQPEQVRLQTYAALAAGYRGIAYRGDADLTRGPGRMLLLEMALLNAEIDLFESIIASGADPIPVYDVFKPDPTMLPAGLMRVNQKMTKIPEQPPIENLKAAAVGITDRKGVLLIVTDFDPNSQFQPSQMAKETAKVTVIVPEGAQAFEVTPGRVRLLERKRVVGGTQFTIPEFDTTSLVLITTDVEMAQRVEAAVNTIRASAALMAIEQAELKLAWATEVNGRLAEGGHYLIEEKERQKRRANGGSEATDQYDLLNKAAANIKTARENLEREDYGNAWAEARRASRPLRILMRGFWDNAVAAMVRANSDPEDVANEELLRTGRVRRKGPTLLVPPVASPALASFNTLPQHYEWVNWMQSGTFGKNLVPSGSFDKPEELEKAGWENQGYELPGVKSSVLTVPDPADPAKRSLRMMVEAAKAGGLDALPPFVDFPAAAIRSPAVKVRAGEFLRISMRVKRPIASVPGAGGVIVRDSIGGEALQFASSEPIPALTRLVIYRRAPADGDLTVTLGLAGYGQVTFDEFAVERAEAAPTPAPEGAAPDAGLADRRAAAAAAPPPPPITSRRESRGRTGGR